MTIHKAFLAPIVSIFEQNHPNTEWNAIIDILLPVVFSVHIFCAVSLEIFHFLQIEKFSIQLSSWVLFCPLQCPHHFQRSHFRAVSPCDYKLANLSIFPSISCEYPLETQLRSEISHTKIIIFHLTTSESLWLKLSGYDAEKLRLNSQKSHQLYWMSGHYSKSLVI